MTKPPSWDLGPDEFAWLWKTQTEFDEYEYPDPMQVVETPRDQDEYALVTSALVRKYEKGLEPSLRVALQTLATSTVRVCGYGTLADSGQVLRSHVALTETAGAVLFQRPTAADGRVFRLTVCRPDDALTYFAATLPPAPPGGAGAMHGYTPRVRGDENVTTWMQSNDGRLPEDERIRKLLRLRRYAEGQVAIESGLRGGRPLRPAYLSWIDIARGFAAGRYMIEVTETDAIVIPASPDVLIGILRKKVGNPKDHRRDAEWAHGI
ncbi:ESX secretion-associated protein EspG [Nocardia sp. NPDC058519]|uniref:ESX secretion-associated protein EspG n=1 Tax=Nocardia sp. NPDC058519 TaxID=3346535 RepID=UPI003650F2FB